MAASTVVALAIADEPLVLRGFLVDGKPEPTSKLIREKLKIYPLSKAANPPKMEFINAPRRRSPRFTPTPSSSTRSWTVRDSARAADFIDPELRGLAANIGIKKGQKFAPDTRMKKILTDAASPSATPRREPSPFAIVSPAHP
jgi:hypothetical protein